MAEYSSNLVIDRSAAAGPQYMQIRNSLVGYIRERKLAPGTRLPSVSELLRTYACSTTTLARAVHELKRDGWVTSRRGSGIYVSENAQTAAIPSESNPKELRVPKLENLVRSRVPEFLNRLQHHVPGTQVIETNERQTLRLLYGPMLCCFAHRLVDLSARFLGPWGRTTDDPVVAPLCHDGRLLMVPVASDVIAVDVNTRVLDEAGVALPREDWTLEELVELVQRVHDPSRHRWGIWARPSYFKFMYLLWYGGGEFFSNDGRRCTLYSRAAIDAMKTLMQFSRLSEPGAAPPNSQNAAVIFTACTSYRQSDPDVVLRPVPGYRRGIVTQDVAGLALNRDATSADAGMAFLNLLMEFQAESGKTPLHADRGQEELSPATQAFRDSLPYARHAFSNIPPELRTVRHDMALHLFATECPSIARGDAGQIEERLRTLERHMTGIVAEDPRLTEDRWQG